MSIKKVVMYVDVDDEELLKDDYFKESFDSWRKEGYSDQKAKAAVVDNFLNLEMDYIFSNNEKINHHVYEVNDPKDEDKDNSYYKELEDWLECEKEWRGSN